MVIFNNMNNFFTKVALNTQKSKMLYIYTYYSIYIEVKSRQN